MSTPGLRMSIGLVCGVVVVSDPNSPHHQLRWADNRAPQPHPASHCAGMTHNNKYGGDLEQHLDRPTCSVQSQRHTT